MQGLNKGTIPKATTIFPANLSPLQTILFKLKVQLRETT